MTLFIAALWTYTPVWIFSSDFNFTFARSIMWNYTFRQNAMLVWIGLVDIRSNVMCTDYYNSALCVLCICPVKQKLGGGVCVSGQGWPCVCAPTLIAAVYWPSSIRVSRAVWLKGTGLRTLEANGSLDKKSSLLPQIHRLNTASRASAAPGANGSENTALRGLRLWLNPSVTAEPRGNVWPEWLLFAFHGMELAFKYIRGTQGLRPVLLTWYLNWKVNPVVGQLSLS